MSKDRFLAVVTLVALSITLVYSATQTTNLQLYKFEVGDLDYPANQNNNMDTLEAAVLDKRVGGTITGNLAVTGTFSAVGLSSTTINGIEVYGSLTGAELQFKTCPTVCLAYNTDENAIYESTGTALGQWRNSRTGTGP